MAQESSSQIRDVTSPFQVMDRIDVGWDKRKVTKVNSNYQFQIIPDPKLKKTIKLKIIAPKEKAGQLVYAYRSIFEQATRNTVAEVDPSNIKKLIDDTPKPPTVCDTPDRIASRSNSSSSASTNPMVKGMNKVFASHFNSCLGSKGFVSSYPSMTVNVKLKNGSETRDVKVVEDYKANGKTYRYIPNSKGPRGMQGLLEKFDYRKIYIRKHYALSNIQRHLNRNSKRLSLTKKACMNFILNQPPIYGYGAKAVIENQKLNLNRDQVPIGGSGIAGPTPASSIDCSGAILSAMALGGLRLTNGSNSYNFNDFGTVNFNEQLRLAEIDRRRGKPRNQRNSCLEVPKVTKASPVKPGDIITVARKHIIMIDQVGSDPFGLNKVKKKSECEEHSHDPRNFDFVLSHSSSAKNMGLHKVTGSAYFGLLKAEGKSTFKDTFFSFVQKVCESGFSSNKSVRATINAPQFYLARHMDDRRECRNPKPIKASHEECIGECSKI